MTDSESDALLPAYVRGYIANPRETFTCELKPWINPADNEYDQVKIAKATLALRNWGGGVLLIGVSDDGKFEPPPYDPEKMFTQDSVQAIVSAYSAEPFGVDIHTVGVKSRVDGVVSVIVVPAGITTPVLCRKSSPQNLSPKVISGALYTRTLRSNGRISSAPASQSDLDAMVKKCHDNRVTDIGQFLRDHLTEENIQVFHESTELPGISSDLEQFAESSAEALVEFLPVSGDQV